MNNDELNAFIERYAISDKTKTAMMLTGEWGSGKSYYIKNSLSPYLKSKNVKSVVVSLYGIDNLSDLSKQIYLRLRLPTLSKKSEVKSYFSIVGYNIIFNILSLNGLTINASDKQLKKLYESVNLNNILLILEDIERSNIDILQLLGFINGLVEYDGAKVLIVANEDELFVEDERSDSSYNEDAWKYKQNSSKTLSDKYFKVKEKTIGDTVNFLPDTERSLMNILKEYTGVWIKALTYPAEIEKIIDLIENGCNYNFRILIYALQKYNNLFSGLSDIDSLEDSFFQVAFEGMLMVSRQFISSDMPSWEWNVAVKDSFDLPDSPVFKFVYDYLSMEPVTTKDVIDASNEYTQYINFVENSARKIDIDALRVLNYTIHKEKTVKKSLVNLEEKLKKSSVVSIYNYPQLGEAILKVGELLEYDTTNLIDLMINQAYSVCKEFRFSTIDFDYREHPRFSSDTAFKEFRRLMSALFQATGSVNVGSYFSYNPGDISALREFCIENKYMCQKNNQFISHFDKDKLTDMFLNCSPEQIYSFRRILTLFYSRFNKFDFSSNDSETLRYISKRLQRLIIEKQFNDRIFLMQINDLCDDLDSYADKIDEQNN